MNYSVEEKGKGKPILFLHGYLSNKQSFYYQTEFLSKKFKTVAVDLPGFGKTPEPEFAYSLDDYVRFVLDVIDEHCGGRADIVAHSFGGRIALKLASLNPQKVGKMLLVGCAGMKPKRGLKYHFKVLTFKALKRISPNLARRNFKKFASPDYANLSPLMRESFKKIVNENLESCAEKITAPCLLVFGSEDRETPLYMARRLNRLITDSGLVVMDGCGHFCFTENASVFNALAVEFFV